MYYFDDAMRETRIRMMMMVWRVVRRDGNAVCADSGGAMGNGMLQVASRRETSRRSR